MGRQASLLLLFIFRSSIPQCTWCWTSTPGSARSRGAHRYGGSDTVPRTEQGQTKRISRLKLSSPTSFDGPDSSTKKSLYHVLGARGDESRAELKQLYISLAKRYHPDAVKQAQDLASDENSTSSSSTTTFAEIASAWRVLSDPKTRKRYDRSLQAEAFSNQVVDWASEVGKQAGPVLERFAIPFLRRTTATTLASVQAALTDLNSADGSASSSKKDADLARTFAAAMAAAKRAGQYVDSVELREQAALLDARAEEKKQANDVILQELQNKTSLRLNMALHTPKSGLKAQEARDLLKEFNSSGILDQNSNGINIFKHLMNAMSTIDEEIGVLEKAEEAFEETTVENQAVQADYRYHLQQQSIHQQRLEDARRHEEECMRALERAREQVKNVTVALDEVTYTVNQAEQYVKKSGFDVERTLQSMEMQSEKVRKTLWQKEHDVLQRRPQSKATLRDAVDDDERRARLEQLNELRKQEELMRESSRMLKGNYQRLQLRAQKLRDRANELEARTATSLPLEPSNATNAPVKAGNATAPTTSASESSVATSTARSSTRRGGLGFAKDKVPLS
jgi:curved DNA-binding protein CbpA